MSNSCILPLKAYAECIRKTACIESGKTIKQCYALGETDESNQKCKAERTVYQQCRNAQILDTSYSVLSSKLSASAKNSAAAGAGAGADPQK